MLGGARSLPIQMRNDGSHFWILDRLCSSDIQFVLCGEHKVKIGAVEPIPLRERTTLNVEGISLCRIVDRVGAVGAPSRRLLVRLAPVDCL